MLIDISVPIRSGMVHWPGDPDVIVEQSMSMDRGDVCNYTRLNAGVHIGTHMDAPRHFIRDGVGIHTMPLDATIGPAKVIAIEDPVAIRSEELKRHAIEPGDRLLFKTANSALRWNDDEFHKDFVYIANEAAQYLVDRQVRTVGVDYLSIGGFFHDTIPTHETLLGAGVWVIEGLNLTAAEPGMYELICLPLKILGADGAPARAALRRV
jgi:arylformamidase